MQGGAQSTEGLCFTCASVYFVQEQHEISILRPSLPLLLQVGQDGQPFWTRSLEIPLKALDRKT